MATALASKPSAPHQKMKRPPLPAVQTNGIKSPQSSPSPLLSSKRPPSGFKAPPTPTLNQTNNTNGVQPRISQRRKESQKAGEISRTRGGKDGERKMPKRKPEPHVKTQAYILEKYRKRQPSLIINLYANNWRFEQQTTSWAYTSPMKVMLEHLKTQTVPHQIIEELMAYGVQFYEGCLIVQVKDHRSSKANSSSLSNAKGSNVAASIHKYEPWVTPSPYVPYPEQRAPSSSKNDPAENASHTALSASKEKANDPKVYTIVLFPTPQSIQEEVAIQANTPDTRAGNRRTGGASIARTPSATVPPTPLSTVPQTPTIASQSAKRQKMSITGPETQQYESKIINGTAPPLFLDPVSNVAEMQALMDAMTDSQHCEKHPAPKTRKRTVAELEEDERVAAQDQAFMLIMDERGQGTGKAANKEEDGTATFEPSFQGFNTLQQIKAQKEERRQQHLREEAQQKRMEHQQKVNRRHQDQKDQKEKEQRAFEQARQRQRDAKANKEANNERMLAHQQAQARMGAAAQNQVPNPHPGMPTGFGQGHSSPVVRNSTPHSNPSPVIGSVPGPHSSSVPMQPTSSGHGSSPGRPPSSMQHVHPAARGVQMVHGRSQQQHPSRSGTPQLNGTPNLSNATPNIPHSTPNIGQATPTSRMAQGTPPAAMVNGMNGNLNGQANGMSPEQQQAAMRTAFFRNQGVLLAQNAQGALPPHYAQKNGQMSPGNLPTNAQLVQHQQRPLQTEAALRQAHAMNAPTQMSIANGQPGPQPSQGSPMHHMSQTGQPQARQIGQNMQQQGSNALQQRHNQIAKDAYFKIVRDQLQKLGHPFDMEKPNANLLNLQQRQWAEQKAVEYAAGQIKAMREDAQQRAKRVEQHAAIQNARNQMANQQRLQHMQGMGHPVGPMGMNAMGPGGQPVTQEQMIQLQMRQNAQVHSAQMQNMQNMQGMGNMNMNGMGGVNGMG